MPLYEYQCTKCGEIEEAIQKFSDPPLTTCRHCSGKLSKLISQSSFHLKGTGWYATGYSKPPASSTDGKAPESKKTTEKSAGSGSTGDNATKAAKGDD
jgi:putative FmdB family regulatory protein